LSIDLHTKTLNQRLVIKTWKVYEAPFTDVKNFQFSMVFRNEDKEKVFEIIEKYKRKEIDARECVYQISDLAVYHCIWV
jgi:hypothetical protein